MSEFGITKGRAGNDVLTITEPPRMTIVWRVLEAAKDAGDAAIVAACRRLIQANRLGWRRHHDPADYRLVCEMDA